MIRLAIALTAVCVAGACSRADDRAAPPDAATAPMPRARAAATRAGTAVVTGTSAASAIVVLVPAQDPAVPRHAPPAIMDQSGQTFVPSLLLVETGQPVQFLNSDDELHNINVKESATKTQAFNVAIPMGQSYRYTFTHDGFYDVTCDIHPAMSASIFVAASPYATVADGDGHFSVANVPPGAYRLTVYVAGTPTIRPIVVTAPRTDVPVG